MKALRLVLITSMCALMTHVAMAQVKIGENELEISQHHWLEIDNSDSLFIVTDDLSLGLTDNPHRLGAPSPGTDALMLKLYGYGFESFIPDGTSAKTQATYDIGGIESNIFAGITSEGRLLEVPLRLVLEIQDSTVADLSFHNGVDTFGTVDLMGLDSIFATDLELRDSTATLRTLINQVQSADGDTISGNEYIDTIRLSNDTLYFTENRDAEMANTNEQSVDLGPLIDATTFYLADGSFDEDRTVDGATHTLTFNDLDSFTVNTQDAAGSFIVLNGNQTTIQQGGQDIIMINGNEDVKFRSTGVDSILFIDSSGSIALSQYGDSSITGSFTNILAVDADGNLIEVGPEGILGTQQDSSIYTHNGTLTQDRTLTGAGLDLSFEGLDTFALTGAAQTTSLTGTQTTLIGGSQTETIIGAQTISVGDTLGISVIGNHATTVGGSQTANIIGAQTTTVGDSLSTLVVGNHVTSVGVNQSNSVGGSQTSLISGSQTTILGDSLATLVTGTAINSSGGNNTLQSAANVLINGDSTKVSEELQLTSYGDSSITGTFTSSRYRW